MSSQFVTAVEQYSPERKEKENGVFLLLDNVQNNWGSELCSWLETNLIQLLRTQLGKSVANFLLALLQMER